MIKIVSIISSVIMIFLFLNEFYSYSKIKTGSEMYIDVNRGGDKLTINIDIDLLHLPCSILSLDVQDIMGSHKPNIGGNLKKLRLNNQGKVINEEVQYPKSQNNDEDEEQQPDYNYVIKQLNDEEGCRVKGPVIVNKVIYIY
jgi:hypothetical protein